MIKFFCPRWGSENIPWKKFIAQVKSAGYNGIEYAISRETTVSQLDEVWNEGVSQGMEIIPQHYDTYEGNFHAHYDWYCLWIEKVRPYPCEKINSQTGKDFFNYYENQRLIQAATDSGLPIKHETHRNKFSFAAHITREYLEKIPSLRLTLDASHWVNVAESFLDDQAETMGLAISRTDHIHARVGYPEGPQVPDPRAKEWQAALNKHIEWWDAVVQLNPNVSITPEFGPFPYMVHDPVSGQPLVNQWDINVYMMQHLRNRYAKEAN